MKKSQFKTDIHQIFLLQKEISLTGAKIQEFG